MELVNPKASAVSGILGPGAGRKGGWDLIPCNTSGGQKGLGSPWLSWGQLGAGGSVKQL